MNDIYFFVGTTAELIKLAPVIRELKKRNIGFKLIASNQNNLHFEELRPLIGKVFANYTFKMQPFKRPTNIYLRFIFWTIKSFGNYLIYFRNEFTGKSKRNIIFIVHGDTVSALIGAIIAKLCGVRLVHIESGLRSYNFLEPFPEEINRFLISWFADVHCCPNRWSIKNLKRRRGMKLNTFYNTVGESIHLALKASRSTNMKKLEKEKYFILVLHRQEHTLFNKSSTEKIINLMLQQAGDNLKCVFIMHKLTKDYLLKQRMLSKIKKNHNVLLPPRLPYLSFVRLMQNAQFIATDGGSNQEEAYFLGLPCIILRNGTERIEGLNENAILSKNNLTTIDKFVKNYRMYRKRRIKINKSPSKIIVDNLILPDT